MKTTGKCVLRCCVQCWILLAFCLGVACPLSAQSAGWSPNRPGETMTMKAGYTEWETLPPPSPTEHRPTDQRSSEISSQVIDEIEFNDATLDKMFRAVAGELGINVVTSRQAGAITGSLYLQDVTFRQFLEVLVRQCDLVYETEETSGTILVFTRLERPAKHEKLDVRQLELQLNQLFPSCNLRLRQLGPSLVVSGEARDVTLATRILQIVDRVAQEEYRRKVRLSQQSTSNEATDRTVSCSTAIRGANSTASRTARPTRTTRR